MLEDRLTLLLCRSSAVTEPEGMALLNAGLMTRPPDRRWMVAGIYDGMVVPRPDDRVQFRFQIFDQEGDEIPIGGVLDGDDDEDEDDAAEAQAEDSVYGRMLIQMPVPPLDELATGLYTLRVRVLNAAQDIPFIVPTVTDDEDAPT